MTMTAETHKANKDTLQQLLISAKQASSILGISRSTFYSLLSQGRMIEPIRLAGRSLWNPKILENWVEVGCPPIKKYQELLSKRKRESKIQRDSLCSSYVRWLLSNRTLLSAKDIPEEFVEAKKRQLEIKRFMKGKLL